MNVSNRQNVHCDSGYIFYDILAPEFLSHGADSFTFAGPEPLSDGRVRNVVVELGRNKYESRFSFDWRHISYIVQQEQPDILIVNQLELLPHFRGILATQGNTTTKIVGYAHYIPFAFDGETMYRDPSLDNHGMLDSIMLDFCSGIKAADAVCVHSETAKKWIKEFFKRHALGDVSGKLHIVSPPRDPSLVASTHRDLCQGPMVYNHRLYAHYGTDFFVDLAPRVVGEVGQDVLVLDILANQSEERRRLDPSAYQARQRLKGMAGVTLSNKGNDRALYKRFLANAGTALAPYRTACSWSMSCIDAQGMGIPVIAPNVAWFAEHLPADLRFQTADEALALARKLKEEPEFYAFHSELGIDSTKHLAPNVIAGAFMGIFKSLKRGELGHERI